MFCNLNTVLLSYVYNNVKVSEDFVGGGMSLDGNQVFQRLQILFPVGIFQWIQGGRQFPLLRVPRARPLICWKTKTWLRVENGYMGLIPDKFWFF